MSWVALPCLMFCGLSFCFLLKYQNVQHYLSVERIGFPWNDTFFRLIWLALAGFSCFHFFLVTKSCFTPIHHPCNRTLTQKRIWFYQIYELKPETRIPTYKKNIKKKLFVPFLKEGRKEEKRKYTAPKNKWIPPSRSHSPFKLVFA